ncbi:MAG: FAD-binding protein [Coriobacteriales bacterium]|jgi:UDP-N-acetylmuramate dehydrogenase|nr:FAD-binding protein [Coriobacteriales bacterium]
MSFFEAYCELEGALAGSVRYRESMRRHTSFRIGGPAALLIECATLADLKAALAVIREHRLPWVIIGKGSNLLVADEGFEGAVLVLGSEFKRSRLPDVSAGQALLMAGGGVLLSNLVQEAFKNGYRGLEFAVGIPGTLGGALFMNAGSADEWIASVVESLTVLRTDFGVDEASAAAPPPIAAAPAPAPLDAPAPAAPAAPPAPADVPVPPAPPAAPAHGADQTPRLLRLDARKLPWEYRHSGIPRSDIIVEAGLRVEQGHLVQIRAKMEASLNRRRKTQPLTVPNAGSVFRNPPGSSAGALIDACGLKGYRQGGASISRKHANFIVNDDNATAADVVAIIMYVRERVKEEHGIELQPEIRFIGFN